jgi:DNA invertase Pin-like site-specific DNA recombinase
MMGQESGAPARVVAKGGRPRCPVSGAEVRELRDQGQSWRQVARVLNIGTATAMRLFVLGAVPKPSQNPTAHPERS